MSKIGIIILAIQCFCLAWQLMMIVKKKTWGVKMTYLDLIRKADYKLDNDAITLGEYEQMIEPLNREIQPERKKSVWIRTSDRDGEYYYCNNCGEELPRYTKVRPSWNVLYPQKYSIDPTDFCPNCGSDNRENKN